MELTLLATWSKLADPGAIIALALTGMFLVLLVLTTVMKMMGVDTSADKEEAVSAPAAKVATPAAPAAPVSAPIVGNTETVSSKPDVDGGVPAETVAVISAAVASVAPEGKQYAVKSIRKV